MSLEGYRFGFQNQEKDNEVKGEGNSINYTFRMHDPRLGRFFVLDPLAAKFVGWSPYVFCKANPIMLIDKDGREATPPDWYKDQYGNIEYREDKSVESWTEHICTYEIDKNRNLTPIGYEERYWTKVNSPLQVAERNSGCGLPAPSLGDYVQGIQKGAEISTEITVGSNGLHYLNGWSGNQYVTTKSFLNKNFTNPILKFAPLVSNTLDAWEIYNGFIEDDHSLGKNTIKEAIGASFSALGATQGAFYGAEFGTLICPGPGTVIFGIIGGIVGGCALENTSEFLIEELQETD